MTHAKKKKKKNMRATNKITAQNDHSHSSSSSSWGRKGSKTNDKLKHAIRPLEADLHPVTSHRAPFYQSIDPKKQQP